VIAAQRNTVLQFKLILIAKVSGKSAFVKPFANKSKKLLFFEWKMKGYTQPYISNV